MRTQKAKDERIARFGLVLFCILITAYFLPPEAYAQMQAQPTDAPVSDQVADPMPADVAPPPLIALSLAEQKALDSENGLKKRTQVSLDMMEARLTRAEQANSQDNFKESLDDLASFQAILQNTFIYLEKNDNNNKADNRFKQLEIFLRRQVPRLETMRRTMPYKFGYYVLKIMRVVRDTRAKAVEPLFAESVVPSSKQ